MGIYDGIMIILDYLGQLIFLLDTCVLEIGVYSVSYFDIIFVFLVIGFVVTLFWKGAKT